MHGTAPIGQYDETTALIVVDTQNDFTDPDGSLYVEGGEKVVPQINAEIQAAQQAGTLVVYTQDWHPQSTPHFQKDGGVWPVHCVQGSWGAQFYPELDVLPDAPVIRKGTAGEDGYSGFTVRDPQSGEEDPTRLEQVLREQGIQRVVVVGLAQDYCVKETALDARRKGFATTLIREGTRPVDLEPGDGARAIEELRAAGAAIK